MSALRQLSEYARPHNPPGIGPGGVPVSIHGGIPRELLLGHPGGEDYEASMYYEIF